MIKFFKMERILLIVALLASGCATYYEGYVNPKKVEHRIDTIAISGFSASTNQQNAAFYIADLLTTKLFLVGFKVVSKEEEADAILVGSIGEYDYRSQNLQLNIFPGTSTILFDSKVFEEQIGNTKLTRPVIALSVRLIGAKTKEIFWSSSFISDPSYTTLGEATEALADKIANEIKQIFQSR
jgi:hypothetical protein